VLGFTYLVRRAQGKKKTGRNGEHPVKGSVGNSTNEREIVLARGSEPVAKLAGTFHQRIKKGGSERRRAVRGKKMSQSRMLREENLAQFPDKGVKCFARVSERYVSHISRQKKKKI